MPHDGPEQADKWLFDSNAQFLANRGYAVLQVNFRGSEGRGSQFLQAGFHEWGGKIQDDIIDGVKAALQNPLIDGNRVCSVGQGFGGYSALMLPVRAPGMFKCAVSLSGLYDLEHLQREYNTQMEQRLNAVAGIPLTHDRFEPIRFALDKKSWNNPRRY